MSSEDNKVVTEKCIGILKGQSALLYQGVCMKEHDIQLDLVHRYIY